MGAIGIAFVGLVCAVLAAGANGKEHRAGMWLTPRKDPSNQARADLPGRMREAPREVWRCATGAEVLFARTVQVEGHDAVLTQAGSVLELRRWSGKVLWRKATLGAVSHADTPVEAGVMHVADFDGDGCLEVCVQTSPVSVVLLDLATGQELWAWQAKASTLLVGLKFQATPRGVRLICFPAFGTVGYCFDFAGSRQSPRTLWQRDYEGHFLSGYGPSVVLADMDRDGRVEVVLTGKADGERVYHAVLDAETGAIRSELAFDAEPGSPLICGRPYGLTAAVDLDGNGFPDLVAGACLVEEYLSLARNVGGRQLEPLWGRKVEKDYPTDLKELQPRLTSLADLRGSGRPELVVGLWEEGRWRTLVIDPLQGFAAQRGSLEGLYFWGCCDVDGDGAAEVIVSRENERRPSEPTVLLALSGKRLQPVAELPDAAVLESRASLLSPLPDHLAFMAIRRDPVAFRRADGVTGILVHRFQGVRETGTFLWGSRRGDPVQAHPVAGPGTLRAEKDGDGLILADTAGRITRLDAQLRRVGRSLTLRGRTAQPLVWAPEGKPELVFDVAGGRITGGRPVPGQPGRLAGRWSVPGSMASFHVDAQGVARMVAADVRQEDRLHYGTSILQMAARPAVLIYTAPLAHGRKPLRIPLSAPPFVSLAPFGGELRLLVNLQTGTHTNALACYDAAGRLLWQDPGWGTYPKLAAAGDVNGDAREEVVCDDHGALKVYDAGGRVVGSDAGWPPAYTIPIIGPFGPNGEACILRASGINGICLIGGTGARLWMAEDTMLEGIARSSRYASSLGAVGDVSGSGRLMLGALAEDGLFECIDTRTGKLRWSVQLSAAARNTSVIAGDVDGDGRDEFLVGLPDGGLVALAESEGAGRVLWRKQFDAAVANPILADCDGDGLAEIVVSTADGYVRMLKE